MARIIVLDNLAQEGLDILEQAAGIECEVRTGLQGDELKKALTLYEGAICRSGVQLDADALAGNSQLRAIVRAGVGTDNIDKSVATRQGIIVMNTPTGNTLSTAEHTFALMLGLSRNTAQANQSLIEGRWDRKFFMGMQLADKTLGVVGLGRIGQEVASRALAFEMRVLGYDPFLSAERAEQLGIELVAEVRDILPRVDYLTVHTPLTPETRNLIDMDELEIIRPGARLINCARGGIYNEKALVAGLASGRLGGVALDVYENEPCTDSPLFGMPGVLCTPHLGASTEEAQTQVAIEAANLLVNFLTTGEIRHAVNTPAVDPKTLESLRGYLTLAYRLGVFMSQWYRGTPRSCRLTYRGDVAAKNTKMLTSAFCAGLIESAMDEEVNIVNSEVLLRERGIEIIEECHGEQLAFSSSIRAGVETDGKTYTAGATLFGNDMPRLILLGNHRLEAYLDGNLLVLTHSDEPGIIGSVGMIFGNHQINIAQMAVGRTQDDPGGEAVGVLNLDSRPADDAVAEILNHPAIHSATIIDLPAAGQLPSWLPA
jgi:D-3-phosphoglycerate dehydrogenase